MRYRLIFLALLFFSIASTCSPPPATPTSRGEAAIRGSGIVAAVSRLSDENMAGRQTGHEGYDNAAKWSLSRFKKAGLKGELQAYPQPYLILDGGSMSATVGERTHNAEMLKDFMPLLFSESGQARAQAVFIGWGIHAPDLGYDDYAGAEVKGKFVLCFRGTPDGDRKWVHHDEHRTRMKAASERGAAGLIYVYPSIHAHNNGDLIPGFFNAMASYAFFDKLLEGKGADSDSLLRQLRETKKPASFPLGAEIALTVKARHFPNAQGSNVVAWLAGSDPALKEECVVIGAHLDGTGDHLGLRFPGAEDNASGSAVVLEIAKAFAKNKKAPKRSIVFALFGSEEQGGRGSAFFLDNLPARFKKVSHFINLDMVGIGTKANIGMTELMEEQKSLLDAADEGLSVIGNIRTIRTIGVRSGDIVPFFKQGIPLAVLGSNGPRPEDLYHLPGDTPDLSNAELMENISKLLFRFAHGLGNV